MIRDRSNPGGLSAIVKGRWKLIDTGSTLELYDTRADPDERSNVILPRAAVYEDLKKALTDHRDRAKRSPFE